jgi:L-lactate dehydrogenase
MPRQVAVVGTGWVGTSVAISVLHAGLADELLLYDVREEVARGEAMDLAHGASFYPHARVRFAPPEEMAGADTVVIAAGRGGRADESRLALARDNAAVVRTLGRRLTGHRGLLVMVTNPVDVLTRVLAEVTGLPPARVIGTGTTLDTARLRHALAGRLAVDPRSVHAQVVGEHGDSEVILWSGARVGGVPLREWPGWERRSEREVADEVRRAAYEIIRRKGVTNHAIGLVTADVLASALRDERRVLTVSRVQDGACGVRDVALSLPAAVGRGGADPVVSPEMDEAERAALLRSAEVLREAAAEIDSLA